MSNKRKRYICGSAHWADPRSLCTRPRAHTGLCKGWVRLGTTPKLTHWQHGRGVSYPVDDGRRRHFWRWNHVCLSCRTHTRRSQWEGTPTCPRCNTLMAMMPRRMRMPKKTDPGWAKATVITQGNARIIQWPQP